MRRLAAGLCIVGAVSGGCTSGGSTPQARRCVFDNAQHTTVEVFGRGRSLHVEWSAIPAGTMADGALNVHLGEHDRYGVTWFASSKDPSAGGVTFSDNTTSPHRVERLTSGSGDGTIDRWGVSISKSEVPALPPSFPWKATMGDHSSTSFTTCTPSGEAVVG